MSIETTYTEARANFARLCDRVLDDHETVVIKRRGRPEVALVAADELRSLEETAHLLRSPRNAERLLTALNRARLRSERPRSVESVRSEIGLDDQP